MTGQLEKILSNLLSNAFKFTPENGCVTCSIVIKNEGFYKSNTVLNIEVSDTGIGISRENISKIFERFYRVEGQWEKDGEGTGIGLSVTSEFISLLHGNIEVTSNIGSGTKFIVRIPLGIEHLSPSEYVIASDISKEDNEYKSGKEFSEKAIDKSYDLAAKLENPEAVMKMSQILVIEDNKDLRDFIKDSLMNDYHVYDAENGRIGVKMALARILILWLLILLGLTTDGIECAGT